MLAAAVAGVTTGTLLGALGSGGAIVLVPLLVIGFGLDAHRATGTALAVVFTTAALGALLNAHRRTVRWREATLIAVPGMATAALVAPVNAMLPPNVLATLLVVLLVGAATRLWWAPPTATTRRGVIAVILTGAAAGGLTGLLGVGGGFVVIPALVLVLSVPMSAAVGTSLVVVAANAGAALPDYWLRGDVDPGLAAVLAAGGAMGVFTGARVARLIGERRLQVSFAGLLMAVAGTVAAREIITLG